MSLESEMKKFNTNLERVSTALEALAPKPDLTVGFNPVTETKIVEPEVKKVSKEPVKEEEPAKKINRTVPASAPAPVKEEELTPEIVDEDNNSDERPPLTVKQIKMFAREKMAEHAEKYPELKIKIKKKIADLGASTISELDQKGLAGLEKFLSEL